MGYLFGSHARGTPHEESDLDIGLVLDPALRSDGRHRLCLQVLEDLSAELGELGERADVVDLDRCDSAVAFAAIRDGLPVHATDPRDRLRFEVYAGRRYDDDAPRRALYRRAATEWTRDLREPRHG